MYLHFMQIIGTAALIVCILAIVDPYNNPIPQGLEAFTVGFVVLVIGLSMGFNSGYAVNPARDLGPRLFTAMAGWGTGVFTYVHRFQPLLCCLKTLKDNESKLYITTCLPLYPQFLGLETVGSWCPSLPRSSAPSSG